MLPFRGNKDRVGFLRGRNLGLSEDDYFYKLENTFKKTKVLYGKLRAHLFTIKYLAPPSLYPSSSGSKPKGSVFIQLEGL